ncbi:hypothetical protein [Actinocrispum sp. NPDC049592]|uniref:hypothetical protein n=1 Tax=Actinocrispum sp. NPDC049592 TaxID=3154835 RepID=UPI00341D7FAB
MGWHDERRKDKAAEQEQARLDAVAAAQIEATVARTRSETELAAAQLAFAQQQQADAAHRADRAVRRAERDARRATRSQRWRARVSGLRAWVDAHLVDLLIYPLAVVSAVMSIPAMSAYGLQVYGDVTGSALFYITELGMWAFALAVQVTRRRHPERPVWALLVGVWAFSAVAFGINALHGLEYGVDAAVVRGVASVAGVVAHQLVTASPRRGKAERDAMRAARLAARKLARIRRAAVHAAVAEIDTDGQARLLFAPGRYQLNRRGFTWRGRLDASIVSGLPVEDVSSTPWPEFDRELHALLADAATDRPHRPDSNTSTHGPEQGPIMTMNPGSEQQKSNPDRRPRKRARPHRGLDQLRAELEAAIAANPGSIDLTSANSIRQALRCAPKFARILRDYYRNR